MRNFVALLFLVFFISTAQAGTSPVNTIKDVQKALDTADQTLFDQAVNMESLIGQCVDIFLEDAQKSDQQTLPPSLAMLLSTISLSDTAKDKIRSILMNEGAEFVRFGVRTGAFAGKHAPKQSSIGVLSSIFAHASMARKEITHIGEGRAESGAIYVPFFIKDHGNGVSYPVEAWLREENGSWRVIGLRNVRTLMRIILGEAANVQNI